MLVYSFSEWIFISLTTYPVTRGSHQTTHCTLPSLTLHQVVLGLPVPPLKNVVCFGFSHPVLIGSEVVLNAKDLSNFFNSSVLDKPGDGVARQLEETRHIQEICCYDHFEQSILINLQKNKCNI